MAKQNQKILVACDPEAFFRCQKELRARRSFGLLVSAAQLDALSLLREFRVPLERGEVVYMDFSRLLLLQQHDTAQQCAGVPFILMTTLQNFRQTLTALRYWGWEDFGFGIFFFDEPRQSEQDRLVLAEFGYCVMSIRAMEHYLRCPGAIQFPKNLSAKDHQLLDCLGLGMTNAEIARELHLPLTRVKTLVRALLTRLDLENRTCAAVLAYWMRTVEAERVREPDGKKREATIKAHGSKSALHCHEKGVAAVLEG